MADSVTTNLPTAPVPEQIFPNSFPPELLKLIFSYSNVISLMNLSATSHVLRRQVHHYFVSRLSNDAAAYPEVREGLARLGWSKDHRPWTCKCFKLMAGPGFTWRRLNERKRFSVVCASARSLINMSTTVAGKTFVVTSAAREIIYWKTPSYSAQGQHAPHSLVSFKNSQMKIWCLSSYDNVLVISLYNPTPINRRSASISVYNPSTLRKITDVEVNAYGGRISEGEILSMFVQRIFFAKDTMFVRLDYLRTGEGLCTEYQIWKINTKEPQEEGISLSSTISHRNSPLPQYIGIFCDVNDRFIVILDGTVPAVKVFKRNEEAVLIRQFGLVNKRLRAIALEKGHGDLIALAFRCDCENCLLKLVLQVHSASRGDLVIRMEIEPRPSLRYFQWFGHHLLVVLEHDSILTMMSWQEGLNSFLTCPLSVNFMRNLPDCGGGSIANWHHVDYRGITSAVQKDAYNGNQVVHFQTWDSC